MEHFDTVMRPAGDPVTLRNDPGAEQSKHFQIVALEGGGFAAIWLAQSGFSTIREPNPDLVVQIFDADADADAQALTGPLSLTGETGLNATVLTGWATAEGGLSMVLETADLDTATIVANATGLVQISTDALGVETARRTLPVPEDLAETGFQLNNAIPLADGGLILDLDRGAYYSTTQTRALYLYEADAYEADAGAPRRLDPSETDTRDAGDGLKVFALEDGALLLVRFDDDRTGESDETVTFQRIAADGHALDATPVEVARFENAYGSADVVAGPDDTFQLVWRAHTPDLAAPRNAIYARSFTADGTEVGSARSLYRDTDPDPISAPKAVVQADGDLTLLFELDLRDPYGSIPIRTGYEAVVLDTGGGMPVAVSQGSARDEEHALTLTARGDVIVSWDAFSQGGANPSSVFPSTTHPEFQHFINLIDIAGGPGDDALTGTEGADLLRGFGGPNALGGKDTLTGLAGNDSLDGGIDNDVLYGGAGNDTLAGGNGADSVFGGEGDDLILVLGTDIFRPDADGPDTIDGGAGHDTIAGGRGNDLIDGGTGNDVITGGDEHDAIDGGTGDDTLDGGDGSDTLTGGEGDDSMAGGVNGDLLDGGAGDDQIFGGNGADTLIGGEGDDLVRAGSDTRYGAEYRFDLSDVIYGGAGDDTLEGGYGNDVLRGDAGADSLLGGFGADLLIGGLGNDVLAGGALGDVMFGAEGEDFFNGGFGSDRMNGGAGADRFYHNGSAGHGSDWIQDFEEIDALVFRNSDAQSAQFQINTTPTPGAGEANIEEAFVIYRPTGQILWALVDGGALDSVTLNINEIGHEVMV